MDKVKAIVLALWQPVVGVCGIVACCLVSGLFMLSPPVYRISDELTVWSTGSLYTARWGLVLVISMLAGGCYVLAGRVMASDAVSPKGRQCFRAFMPLSLLPLISVVLLMADVLPVWLVSNGVYFGTVLIVSVVAYRLFFEWPKNASGVGKTRHWGVGLLLVGTVAFALIGKQLSTHAGEHVGDEGHYLIQANSLFHDRDLDIKNNLLPKGTDPATVDLQHYHINPRSKDGHWYSWHPFGLSVLLAPFWSWGMPLRQWVLGLISGIGCVGMFLLCLRLGASRRSSLVAVSVFAASVYWALYSARTLPEVLGATLLIWAFWAISAQKDRPWVSVVVAAGCCIYLPFAHFRFLPLSLMGAGLYGLFGLCGAGTVWSKVRRLAVLSGLCLAGAGMFFGMQGQMFASGAAYPVSDVLFSYPWGAWAVLVDSRGVSSVLPLFMWLAAAWLVWVVRDQGNRWFALGIGATFLACLLTSCTNACYTGGASIPGRYLLVVVPLLIPAAACMLDRSSPLARGLFVFLGVISVGILLVTLVRLPSIGRYFVLPFQAAGSHPILRDLYFPHALFLEGNHLKCGLTSLYVLGGVLLCVWLLAVPACKKWFFSLSVMVLISVGAASHRAALSAERPSQDAGTTASALLRLDLDRALVIRKDSRQPVPLFSISREVFRDVQNPVHRHSVTTRDLGKRSVGMALSQPRIEKNDWDGRDFRWATMTTPFTPSGGRKLIHIGGRLTGDAALVFAVREGNRTLFEGPVPVNQGIADGNIEVPVRGKSGHLYLLVRLEQGEGEFQLDDLSWTPCSDRLLTIANLQRPKDTVIIRQ